MGKQKYTYAEKLIIGQKVYEELIETKYDPNVILVASCKYGYAASTITSLVKLYRNAIIDPKPTQEQEILFNKYRNEYLKRKLEKSMEKVQIERYTNAKKTIEDYANSSDVFPYFIAGKYYNFKNQFTAELLGLKNGTPEEVRYYELYRKVLEERKTSFIEMLQGLIVKLREGHEINGKHISFEPYDYYDQYDIRFSKFKAYVQTIMTAKLKNETPFSHEDIGLLQKFIGNCELLNSHLTGNLDRIVATKYYCDGRTSTPEEIYQILEYLSEKNIPINKSNVTTCYERMCRGLLRKPEKQLV